MANEWLKNIVEFLVGDPTGLDSTSSITQPDGRVFDTGSSLGMASPGLGGGGLIRNYASRLPLRGQGGRFLPRSRSTDIVPRPSYEGIRVTGGTSVVPKDPGWRYGGPNWRFGGQGGPSAGEAARTAASQARNAPGTSLVPRRTSLVPLRTNIASGRGTRGIADSRGAVGGPLLGEARNLSRAAQGGILAGGGLAGRALGNLIGGDSPSPTNPSNIGMPGQRSTTPSNTDSMAGNFPDILGNLMSPIRGVHNRMMEANETRLSEDAFQQQLDQYSSTYDAQIAALGGQRSLARQQGQEAQRNIGSFYDYAGDVAREGMPVTQQVYDDASGNVNQIHDNLQERLGAQPQQLTDIARAAGGSGVASSVADRVSAATAPFMAAGESGRASALGNLTQHSSAGQSYLNNLASSAPMEAAMGQSQVEHAVQQQLQQVAYRQAELEGARQRGLMEITSDLAGSTAEQMANQALAHALGLDLPGNVDPMDFLRGQELMQGNGEDTLERQRDEVGLEQSMLNLEQDMNPNWERDSILGELEPSTKSAYDNLLRSVETTGGFTIQDMQGDLDPQKLALEMLKRIDDVIAADQDPRNREANAYEALGLRAGVHSPQHLENTADELRRAIRNLHM